MFADRFRFSLRTLMVVIAGLAVSTALLAKPGITAASAVLSLTLLVLGVALVGAMTCGLARRPF